MSNFRPSLRALYSEECPLYWKVPPLCVKIKYTTVPHRPRKELALTKHANSASASSTIPLWSLTFFLLSLGALALDGATGGWTTTHLFCVYRSSLKDPLFYLRLFGHVLGHADLEHFLSNMLLFLVVGPPMEEKYGSVPLLQAIVLTAFVSGVLQCILFPGGGAAGGVGHRVHAHHAGLPVRRHRGHPRHHAAGGRPLPGGSDLRHPVRTGQRGQLHAHRGRGVAAPPSAFTAPMPAPPPQALRPAKSHTLVPRTGDSKAFG